MVQKTGKKGQRFKIFSDELAVKRIGGGSIIDRRPLFSHDGEVMYIIRKNVIRANGTKTGDFIREFEPVDNKIISITFNSDNYNTVVGCTVNGELINWDARNGLIVKKLKLKTHENVKVETFHLVKYICGNGHPATQALLTYVVEPHRCIQIALYDLETEVPVKSTTFEHICDYYVDIIGNYENNLVAIGQDNDLHILQPGSLSGMWHKLSRRITCVSGHPEELCVATGDTSGRVLVWHNLFKKYPAQGTYHWHSLPVMEIAFSKSGGHMYTGGGECVLVKWVISNPKHKAFLPRLPAPIKYLSVAPENLYISISTLDNGISIINSHNKLVSVVQNFTWAVTMSRDDLFPAGLTLDPRTDSLVMNSRTGHVQFFDTHIKSLLHNIDITIQNKMSQTRNMNIVNTEVTKIALNDDGSWLATVEERDDQVSSPEVRLKFWKYISEIQTYSLNTCIELPHKWGVTSLKFQPKSYLDNDSVMAVTTGKDNQFKLWELAEPESMYKTTKTWQCCGFGDYRNLPSVDSDFSIDGSLLGVAFGSSLTLWNPVTNEMKGDLSNSLYNHPLKRVEFGKQEACHLVVVSSAEHLAVWNLLTLRITWTTPLHLVNLTSDIHSVYMAAFTKDNTLFVFTPQSSEPVYKRENLLDDDCSILGACFVPNSCEKLPFTSHEWQKKSQLYFLSSNQELLTLETESEAAVSLENLSVNGNLPLTAFSNLVADKSSTNVEKDVQYVHKHFGKTGKNLLEELSGVPPHTLPPMSMLCLPLIMSMRVSNDRSHANRLSQKLTEKIELNGDQSVDHKKKKHDEGTKKSEFEEDAEINPCVLSFDWSFVAKIFPDKSCANF